MAPLHVGIEAVIGCSALILVFESLLRRFRTLAIFLDNALCPLFHAGMDEDSQAVFLVFQDIVGTSADNDTW